MKEMITAGVVTFNPDLDRLMENIKSIVSQVDKVLLFDNGSQNQIFIESEFQDMVIIIKSEKNVGIAAALNGLMKKSKELGATWMISLDQDSVCPPDFCDQMKEYLYREDDFGIVAPVIIDRNVGVIGHNPEAEYKSVKTCITSGSFTKIEAWDEVAGYDESMFIDSVDFEFCYRIRRAGYQVIQVRDVKLIHELGNSEKRRFLLWQVNVKNHSSFRKYYIARNNVYYPLKHRIWLHLIRGFLRNARLILVVLLYEQDKVSKVKVIAKGTIDGLKPGRKVV